MRVAIVAAVIACSGCAALSNVTPLGDGAFMTVVRSNDVNARVPEQQAKAMGQATAFCADRQGSVEVVRWVAAPPPPGQPPAAELDFRCNRS